MLAGYGLILDSANALKCSKRLELRYFELLVPSAYSRLHSESTLLAVYSGGARNELERVLPLGCPDNRSVVSIGLRRSQERHLPAHVLSVDHHAIVFRCKEECDLWSVVIDDLSSCDEKRFAEVVHSRKSPDGPKGYRSHIQNLRTLLAEQIAALCPPENEIDDSCLLANASKCITILSSQCKGILGLETEDLIRDTLSKLSKRISNC